MDFLNTPTKSAALDQDGFLVNVEDWDEDVAREFAKLEGIELVDDHWKVLYYVRDYWQKFGSPPLVLKICKENGLKIDRFRQLFPEGLLKIVCRLAGLPKPAGCV